MAAATPNRSPDVLSGTLAQRPSASKVKVNTIYKATDASVYMLTRVGGVSSWVDLLSGSTALSAKYWVNVAGQQPVVGYTTLQAANDAAVADGHSAANPAVICCYPGTYTENVILGEGISLRCVGGNELAGAVINGTLTIHSFTSVGILIDGITTMSGVTFGDGVTTNNAVITFRGCVVNINTVGIGIEINAGGGTSAKVILDNTLVQCAATSNCIDGDTYELDTLNGSSISATKGKFAIYCGNGGKLSLADTNITGEINNAAGNMTADLNRCVINATQINSAIIHGAAGSTSSFNLYNCRIRGIPAGTPLLENGGTISVVECEIDAGVKFTNGSAAGNASTYSTMRNYTYLSLPGAANTGLNYLNADIIGCSGVAGAAFSVTLPGHNSVAPGARVIIRNDQGSAVMTIAAGAGDTIEGAASKAFDGSSASFPVRYVELQYDYSATTWYVVNVGMKV